MPPDGFDFSVVVPVHNSAESLEELHKRLAETFESFDKTFEIVFVNDGSTDESLSVLRNLHATNDNIRVIDMIRNQGQHTALMCGFQFCSAAVVVTIDDDLQHAPEDVPAMYERLQEGYDAVFGAFEKKRHGFIANIGSAALRRVSSRLFHPPKGFHDSAYRMVRSEIIAVVKEIQTPFPFVSGMILSATNRVTNVTVEHTARKYGASGYSHRARLRLSYNLLINYSALPLRFMGFVGLLASLGGLVLGFTHLILQSLNGTAPPGWTSLVVVGSFFGAIMFLMIFAIGEYLSRILKELSHGSAYAIREQLTQADDSA